MTDGNNALEKPHRQPDAQFGTVLHSATLQEGYG